MGLGNMQAQIHDSESLTLRRPIITLLASFGSLALILVIVGVFGVTSYSVAERTREIGIRVALGAARREIAGLVLRESLGVTLVGLAVGTFGAFAMTCLFPTAGIGWSGSGIFLYGVFANGQPHLYIGGRAADECRLGRVVGTGTARDACRSHDRLALRVRAHVTAAKPIRRIAVAVPKETS